MTQMANTVFESTEVCREDDSFPIIGSYLSKEEMEMCFREYSKRRYKRNWDCVSKAIVAAELLSNEARGDLVIHVGSCYVLSEEVVSSYGYEYNPPLEIHAWTFSKKQGVLYDLAMPGVILSGKEAEDELGPFLGSDVQPVVIAESLTNIPRNFKYKVADIRMPGEIRGIRI